MNIPCDTDRLRHFASLYERARCGYGDRLDELARCREQYEGSLAIDGSSEAASAVRNITYELIESQISSEIPTPHVDPFSYTEERARCALSVERLCAQTRTRLRMEELNNEDERNTYIYGGSLWLVEWDATRGGGRYRGDVTVNVISPEQFIPQPGMTKLEDMDYCFLVQETTREALAARYGAVIPDGTKPGTPEETNAAADTLRVITCYWKNGAGEVCRTIWSGDILLSDTEGFYRRRKTVCRACGKSGDTCGCGDARDPVTEILTGELPIPRRAGSNPTRAAKNYAAAALFGEIPYYVPERFPLILRRNTAGYRTLLGQSDCLIIRPQQQQINMLETRIRQKLMRAGVTPMMPEDARITLNNSVFGQVLKLREGERADAYGTLDTTPDISQDVAQSERLYQQAKRIIGITDTFQGESDAYAQSGVAKQLQINQAAGRLESKRRMKLAAYAELDRMIFTLCLAYADEPRAVSYRDSLGRAHRASFNRYDFLAYDGRHGTFYFDDDYLFSADRGALPETRREEVWARNLENLQSGTMGNMSDPETLLRYWQSQERVHYPFARENVEYFEDVVRAAKERRTAFLREVANGRIPPEAETAPAAPDGNVPEVGA